MELTNQVIQALEESRGHALSGEMLAKKMGVSRSAVWKAIRELRQAGYQIEAASGRGYQLSASSDVLSPQGIALYLPKTLRDLPIEVYPVLASTNTLAKQRANQGAPEGTVVIADQQTQGRGRRGRSFYSPAGSGLYLSMILRPGIESSQGVLYTTAASVAISDAIAKTTGCIPGIKWVNDLMIGGRKICGILTEAVTDLESGHIQYLVIGAGINVRLAPEGFPDALTEIAGSLEDLMGQQNPDRAPFLSRVQLAASVIEALWQMRAGIPERKFLQTYRERSVILGQEIWYEQAGRCLQGIAKDIDETGSLLVERADGEIERLSSGEISVRRKWS